MGHTALYLCLNSLSTRNLITMLNRIKNKKVVSVYKPVEFPIIENDKISEELDVKAKARQQAKKELPPTNSASPDSNEISFRSYFQTKLIQNSHSVQQSLTDLSNEINNLSINQHCGNAMSVVEEYEQTVRSEITPIKRELTSLKKQLDLAEEDIEQFKTKNRLNREADYPVSKLQTFGVLLVALIIESFLNGLFFAEGSDSGLLGGIGIAAMVAVANIAFGFILGWLVLRYKNHIANWRRNLSITISFTALLLSFIGNLFIAHYREALSIYPDEAHTYVWESINNGWMSISTISSWLLLVIGLLFYILAVFKGYHYDDAYPEYGKYARKKEKALDDLAETKDEAIFLIDEKYDSSIESLDRSYDEIKRLNTMLSNYVSSFEIQDTIFKNYYSHLKSALLYVTKLYRDLNSAERNTPPPEFFETDFDFQLDFAPLEQSFKDKREELTLQKEELEKQIPSYRDGLLKQKTSFHMELDEVCH